jgi:hypothetical protein
LYLNYCKKHEPKFQSPSQKASPPLPPLALPRRYQIVQQLSLTPTPLQTQIKETHNNQITTFPS